MSDLVVTDAEAIPARRWFFIIVPILVLCIVSYMDRTNIGFAIPGGMSQDLGMSASFSGLAAGIFFIGYLFLQVPGGQLASRGKAKLFLTCSMVVWGLFSIATYFITTPTQLLAIRFMLGIAEGGMLPVVLTMISKWFPNEERARAQAITIMFVPIASMISAPLAGTIIQSYGWRELFLIEGIFTFILIIPWLIMVEEDPEKAKWLSARERDYITSKLRAEQLELAQRPQIASASLGEIMKNGVMWKLITMNFFYQMAIATFVTWLPTLLKTLMNTGMTAVGWLALLPYVGTMAGMLTIGALSDKTGKRRVFVVLSLAGFAVSLMVYLLCEAFPWIAYTALIGVGFFLQAAAGVFWTIPPRLFPARVAGGARGVINALGTLGGFVGPFLVGWFISTAGSTDYGLAVMVAALVAAIALTYSLPKTSI